ncbi:hypothetical protein Acsp05_46070 [Actinokineospora sp. NBRC 105648]|nr:hypothetical protein Acsp05_46070 [Actinokineospora sp. NBRC 105648]
MWTAGVMAALLCVVLLVAALGSATVARHRAESAADLGALAAAASAVSGQERACAKARWVAQRMGAELALCRLDGWVATVRVSVRPAATVPLSGRAWSQARAGPVVGGSTVGPIR